MPSTTHPYLDLLRKEAARWHSRFKTGAALKKAVAETVARDLDYLTEAEETGGLLELFRGRHAFSCRNYRVTGYDHVDMGFPQGCIARGIPVLDWRGTDAYIGGLPMLKPERPEASVEDLSRVNDKGHPIVGGMAYVGVDTYVALAVASGARLLSGEVPGDQALTCARVWLAARAKQAADWAREREENAEAEAEKARLQAEEDAQPFPNIGDWLRQEYRRAEAQWMEHVNTALQWNRSDVRRYLMDALNQIEDWPTMGDVRRWTLGSTAETPGCGCTVEPDGTCPHGVRSWPLVLGVM